MPAPLFMSSWSAVRQQGRVRWWFVSLVLLVAVATGAWWWKQQQAPAAASTGAARTPGRFSGAGAAQPVSVGVVQRQDVRVMVSAIGTMSARATAVVRAKAGGELLSIKFKEGDEVKAGQLLAEIDPRSYQATLTQAQGNLQRD